jgi:hypothetical protein
MVVVIGLALAVLGTLVALVIVLAMVTLTDEQKTIIVTALVSLGTTALGGLTALLAHTSAGDVIAPAPDGAAAPSVPPAT